MQNCTWFRHNLAEVFNSGNNLLRSFIINYLLYLKYVLQPGKWKSSEHVVLIFF